MVQKSCCDFKHLSSILHRYENTIEHKAEMLECVTKKKGMKHEKHLSKKLIGKFV